jgi:hypothetical protein
MKFYSLFLLTLIILSSCGSVCAERVIPNPPTFSTHIDINDKCGVQKVYIPKGKNLELKAELWAEKSGSVFKHNEYLAHEKLLWFVFRIDDHHYQVISTKMRTTNMFGNSYQRFQTGQLEKGKYEVCVNYFGGSSYFLRYVYNGSSQGIEINVT